MYLGDLGPFDRTTALKEIEAFRSDPQCLLLAVTDLQAERAGSDAFAGIYGFIEASDEYMVSHTSAGTAGGRWGCTTDTIQLYCAKWRCATLC